MAVNCADVVDLESTGAAIAQQHVGGVAAEESAEAGIAPIGSDPTELIPRQDRVVADVVDFILAHHGGRVGRLFDRPKVGGAAAMMAACVGAITVERARM